jgi:hypothetical protein
LMARSTSGGEALSYSTPSEVKEGAKVGIARNEAENHSSALALASSSASQLGKPEKIKEMTHLR